MEGEDLIAQRRLPDGSVEEALDNDRWRVKDPELEIERLGEHRSLVEGHPQLDDSDRQAILQSLDQILGILRQSDLSEEELVAALEGSETALEAMIDPEAGRQKETFQEMAQEVGRKSRPIQAIAVYNRLSAPGAEQLQPGDLQGMARQLGRAAEELQPVDSTLAGQLQGVSERLLDGDVAGARDLMSGPAATIDQLVGSLGTLVDALEAEEYTEAIAVLRNLTDSATTPLGPDQLAVLPGTLEAIADPLEDDSPLIGQPLAAAVESLEAGNTEEARVRFAEAADNLGQISQAIVRGEAAQSARVARAFWGVDNQNHAVRWEKGTGEVVWQLIPGSGWMAFTGGPVEYIPLQKGLLRADPGVSLRTGRPVSDLLFVRLRNSLVLAGIAFAIVMPLALLLGLIAGLNEGKLLDRVLSIGGMMFSVSPEFATGIFLILIFAFWLELVPGATVFGEDAPWTRPDMLVLPVLTLTLIELGYVLRITRASMADVMKAPYIRTAFLKGLPRRRVVTKHAIRNALMAPITVIMLHVNWLLGGIVVVEVIFGYPGLGSYLLDSALFKDFNAIEAGAIILVAVAVTTQLLADVVYTFLNPRIRYT
jgi:peptide/nickel transport system permease protein